MGKEQMSVISLQMTKDGHVNKDVSGMEYWVRTLLGYRVNTLTKGLAPLLGQVLDPSFSFEMEIWNYIGNRLTKTMHMFE